MGVNFCVYISFNCLHGVWYEWEGGLVNPAQLASNWPLIFPSLQSITIYYRPTFKCNVFRDEEKSLQTFAEKFAKTVYEIRRTFTVCLKDIQD